MASSPSSERRLLGAVGAVHRDEWPFALLMFTYVFLVIGDLLDPEAAQEGRSSSSSTTSAGSTLAGRHFAAAEAELLAKVLNMVVAIVAVAAVHLAGAPLPPRAPDGHPDGRLRRRPPRLRAAGRTARAPATVWSFYLFGDLFSTLMVATFFAFLNDSVTPGGRQAPVRLRSASARSRAASSASSVIGRLDRVAGRVDLARMRCAAAACRSSSPWPSRAGRLVASRPPRSRRRPSRARRAAIRPSRARRWSCARPTCCRSPPSSALRDRVDDHGLPVHQHRGALSSMARRSGRISRACSR